MELQEIFQQSRRLSLSATSFTRRFVYEMCLSEEEYEAIEVIETGPDSVFGVQDDIYVVSMVSETFPDLITVEGYSGDDIVLVLDNVEISQVADFTWRIELEYTLPSGASARTDFVRLSFQASATQVNRKQSIALRNSASRTGYPVATPPNPYRAIGVSDGSVEGAEIYVPGLSFSLTKYFDPTLWNSSLIPTWGALQTKYNNDVFYGCSAGEVLFLAFQGEGSQYNKIPVTFEFLYSPNLSAVADEGFPALTALGHDIIDYRFEELVDVTTTDTVRYPTYRYVHQAYYPGDFDYLTV